jgi:glycosyltransferase involved in cell wall biosynthesis
MGALQELSMRFLMLNWRDPFNPMAGGAERVTLAYLQGLAERGHEVWWFANSFPGAKRESAINQVRIVRGGGIGSSIFHAWRWQRTQRRFDLVIDQHHGIPWFAPWWAGARTVAYLHEVLGPIWDSFYPWPWNALGKWQERWTHWLYRKVPFWTASTSTRENLLQHGVREITIIPYGVSTEALPELEPKPLSQPLQLIAVSRLAPNKRVDHAIRAVHRLAESGVEARLMIVGTGEEELKLKKLAGELNLGKIITFTGHLEEEEKNKLLERSHFLLHNSQREGWGLNVIEANAMGAPAVVYPVAGLVESTLHEKTGLVTEAETPESMAAVLKEVLKRPEIYQPLRLNAWNRSKLFHWRRVLPDACDWLEAQARGERASEEGG